MSINRAYLSSLCDRADEALEAARDDDATMQMLLGATTSNARCLTNLFGGEQAWDRLERKHPGVRAAFAAFLDAAERLYSIKFLPEHSIPLWGSPDELEAATQALRATLAPPAADPPAPITPKDEQAIADALRIQGAPTQARLVEFMIGREKADFDDVKRSVHDDAEVDDRAVRQRVFQVNRSLAKLQVRLCFKTASGRVFKVVSTP